MASITVKVLNDIHRRGKADMCPVLTNKLQICDLLFFDNERTASRLLKGNFYRLISVNIITRHKDQLSIRATPKTRVFETIAFDVPSDVEQDFYNAPEVRIADALACSDEHRRLSIVGKVKSISPVKHGANWTKREVTITDDISKQSIVVNLWGQQASSLSTDVDNVLKISNVETSEYNNFVSLNATPETTFTAVSDELIEEDVTIIGIANDVEPFQIITDEDKIFEIDQDKLSMFVKDFLPVECTITFKRGLHLPKIKSVTVKSSLAKAFLDDDVDGTSI